MNDKQRTYGQFETPVDLADLLLGFCLRRPEDRLLDPSCGQGALLARAAQMQDWLAPARPTPDTLWGVELDPAAVALAQERLPQAHITQANFFQLTPPPETASEAISVPPLNPFPTLFDAIIGNPPYTRAEWIDGMQAVENLAQQLNIFAADEENAPGPLLRRGHPVLSRRAGLHAYFFVHGTGFLREGGRFGFIVPNSWLDIAYGERLKRFLLDHFKILAIIESNVERWFEDAKVNTCLVILEKCHDRDLRSTNRVRLVRLRRPIAALLPFPVADARRLAEIERLVTRMLTPRDSRVDDMAVNVVQQHQLRARSRWGIAMRAPSVFKRRIATANLVPAGKWATIQRGFTTGANNFFYVDDKAVAEWGIEERFLKPCLKSLRQVKQRRVSGHDSRHRALIIPPHADLGGSQAAAYIAWGQSEGIAARRTCAAREPWYQLPNQHPADILLPKGIWERHFAPLMTGGLLVDQQIYAVHLADGVDPLLAAALFNSAWFALQLELYGRVNFGEGVLWLAGYELSQLHLPDPRYMPTQQQEALKAAYKPLLDEPVATIQLELADPRWIAFNMLVAAIMGFSAEEATEISDALLERVATRRHKATYNRRGNWIG